MELMLFIIPLLFCVLAAVIGFVSVAKVNGESKRRKKEEETFIEEHNIKSSLDYAWEDADGSNSRVRFISDEQAKKLYLFCYGKGKRDKHTWIIPYDAITDCNVCGEANTDDVASSAIVGGLVAGVLGAVVSVQEAQENGTSVVMTLYSKNLEQEKISFPVWGSGMAFFDSIKSRILAIIEKNRSKTE